MKGLEIKGERVLDYEMREATMDDVFQAEMVVGSDRPIKLQAAIMARQLVRMGEYRGPFTPGMLAKLTQADFRTMRNTQEELVALGEPEKGEQQDI
ncbi:hypothetical protein [Methylogaea oryzae]|uniref:hypothetical protein n=1 Tax=Methylogaea oryzae TaxID=1295382 RepID=UPI0012E2260A|nr:hypothetical protein [Methylogaea oryzae]